MSKTYKSEILAAIHETVSDIHEAQVFDKKTMRKYDDLCLTKVEPLSSDEIRELRLSQNVSQSVFALYLNVSKGLISQWERGKKKPSGASLKLLSLVKENGLESIA